MVSSHPSPLSKINLKHIRASQKSLQPVTNLNYSAVVDQLSKGRSKQRDEQEKWDLFFGQTSLQTLPTTDPLRLADLSVPVSKPDAATEYVPSLRRPRTDTTPPVPNGRRTKKHDIAAMALRIALTETVKLLLQEHLDEHDELPFQIRMRDSLAKKFLKAKLIYQGHIIFYGILIPLITDPSIGENIAYLVY